MRCGSPYTLRIMTIAAAVFTPIVIAYQAWSYWIFRKRLSVRDIPEDHHEPADAVSAG